MIVGFFPIEIVNRMIMMQEKCLFLLGAFAVPIYIKIHEF